jgi:hypothetical protein
VEIELTHFFRGSLDYHRTAGFERYHKRKLGMRIARLLQNGIDTDRVLGQHGGNDSNTVASLRMP